MITLKGKSYRLRERGLDVARAAQAPSLRDLDAAARRGPNRSVFAIIGVE
jgi:hypothetical protein